MLSNYFDAYATGYQPYKNGSWCYEDGCLYRGLEMLHRATGEDHWLEHLTRLISAQIGKESGSGLAGYNPSEYNIDHILSGRALLYLHEQTGNARYLSATAPLLKQLETHPRTQDGVYWHKLRYPWQVWLDGLYMAAPFQIELAMTSNTPAAIDDSITQILSALEKVRDPETGLYAHAYDEARMQAWSDPDTGRSPAFWARSIGWLAMCLVDVMTLLGTERSQPLKQATIELLNEIQALRQPNGLWLQVIDQPDLEGNYEEASASAMFIYALSVAEKLGLITATDDELLSLLLKNTVQKNADDRMEMTSICGVAGLGGFEGKYRDGSAEYYLSESIVADDPKGVGPLMMCVGMASEPALILKSVI